MVIWELLHGVRPFRDKPMGSDWSENLGAMAQRRYEGPPQPSARPTDRLTRELTSVLQISLQPDPQDRWQDGSEFSAQLQLCLNPRAQQLLNPPAGNSSEIASSKLK